MQKLDSYFTQIFTDFRLKVAKAACTGWGMALFQKK
jgi:hypothetical protein